MWNSVVLELGLEESNIKAVTTQAFTLARKRLNLKFFRSIWNVVIQKFAARFSESMMRYKGFLLMAIDGTKVTLPSNDELLRQFGGPTNQTDSRCPQAMILGLVNVLTGFCLDFLVVPYRSSENKLLRFLLKRLPKWARLLNPLLLLDAGFFSHMNIIWLDNCNISFLIRTRTNIAYKKIKQLGIGDFIVEMKTSPFALRKDDRLPKKFQVRLIHYQIPGFRPSFLTTNLTVDELNGDELVALYHERWRIEVFYREVKHTLSLTNLRSNKCDGIYKEIYAQLTVNNLIRYIMTEAVENTGKSPVQFSFQRSYCLIQEAISKMLLFTNNPYRMVSMYKAVLMEILSYEIKQRPGRRYPREYDNSPLEEFERRQFEPNNNASNIIYYEAGVVAA
jgi:hypothetical protein